MLAQGHRALLTVQGRAHMIDSRDDGPPPVVEVEKPSLRTLLLRVRGKLDDAAITNSLEFSHNRLAPGVSRNRST
jgi:hypothetical protein